jgi:predicted neutral ceramidase superfamily lipid hydrolase
MKIANYESILKINSMKTSPLSILLKGDPCPYYRALRLLIIYLIIYWNLMIAEFCFTLILNPTFKLIVWIYLFVFFPVAIISGFVFEGSFYSILRLKLVKIKTNYGEIISGFLTGKGNDHVMVLTEKGEIFLPITNIEKIIFL